MKYWARFGEAQREAGFAANEKNQPYDENILLRQLATLARELRRFPTFADLRVKEHADPAFPNSKTFQLRLGAKADLVQKVLRYCETHSEYADVLQWCPTEAHQTAPFDDIGDAAVGKTKDGFVYLMKSGRFYKIGKTNHVGRRERELAIQLPEQVRTIHEIKTDDPEGIEVYWHNRFASKRQRDTEWFALKNEDVAAFRRRKFM